MSHLATGLRILGGLLYGLLVTVIGLGFLTGFFRSITFQKFLDRVGEQLRKSRSILQSLL